MEIDSSVIKKGTKWVRAITQLIQSNISAHELLLRVKKNILLTYIVCFNALNKIICKHKEPKLLVNILKNLFYKKTVKIAFIKLYLSS